MEAPKIEPRTIPFNELMKVIALNTGKLTRVIKLKFVYLQLITGKGLEFEKLREYTPQDDARFIDWKATARIGKPFVKVFREERMLDVIFVVDVSNTMLLGTTHYLKNEYASIFVGIVGNAALEAGDLVGLLLFSDKEKLFSGPTGSADEFYGMLKALTEPKYYGGAKNFGSLPRLLLGLRDESAVFLVSDFIGTYGDAIFRELVEEICNKFNRVFGVMIRDPVDSKLPKGVGSIYLADPVTGELRVVNVDKIRKEYELKAKREESWVEKVFKNSGGEFFKAYTNEDFTDMFVRYLEGM